MAPDTPEVTGAKPVSHASALGTGTWHSPWGYERKQPAREPPRAQSVDVLPQEIQRQGCVDAELVVDTDAGRDAP